MLSDLVVVFFATISIALLFNAPKKRLFFCGVVGCVAYFGYLVVMFYTDEPITATFVGAFCLGITSEIFARIFKTPAIVFSIPGSISLVPGFKAYTAAKLIIEGKNNEALEKALLTMGIAAAIALGIMLSTSVIKIFKDAKNCRNNKKIDDKNVTSIPNRH